MGIREAFSSVPAKPVMAVVLGFTVLAAGWHGWKIHDICNRRAGLTLALHDWAQAAIARPGARFRLDEATDFDWDQTRISQGEGKTATVQNCPFGWHWSSEKRAAMAKAGTLTLIGFFNGERLVEIADFDRRWAEFEIPEGALARDRAVFVNRPGTQVMRVADPQ